MSHSQTGCKILDDAGVTQGGTYLAAEVCINQCPLEHCVLDRNNKTKVVIDEEHTLEDITVQCSRCHNIETLTLVDGELRESRYQIIHGLMLGWHYTLDRTNDMIVHLPCGYSCKIIG
jgi:hypothetical protein